MIAICMIASYTTFLYKQLFYKQPGFRAQNTKQLLKLTCITLPEELGLSNISNFLGSVFLIVSYFSFSAVKLIWNQATSLETPTLCSKITSILRPISYIHEHRREGYFLGFGSYFPLFTLFFIKQLLSNFERQNCERNKQLLGLTT